MSEADPNAASKAQLTKLRKKRDAFKDALATDFQAETAATVQNARKIYLTYTNHVKALDTTQ